MKLVTILAALLVLAACAADPPRLSSETAATAPSAAPDASGAQATTTVAPIPAAAPTSTTTAATSAAGPTSTTAAVTQATSTAAAIPPTAAPTPVSTAAAAAGTGSSASADQPARPTTIAALLALGRPIVLAHTGGEGQYPGSTLFGYSESDKAGVDVLDLNVMLTSDGVLVVQHDDSVDRLTNGTGKVGGTAYADLSKLDNAYWFTAAGVGRGHPADAYTYRGIRTGDKPPPPGYTPDDFAVPRFSDLVGRFPDSLLNIEIEGSGAPAAAAATELAKELHDLHREDASVVTSFDDATVDVFHQLSPGVEVTPGLGASAAWILNGTPLPPGMRILQLPPEYSGIKVLTPASIAASHRAGYLIWVWPNDRALENATSYARFVRQGIDGLNIDFPAEGVVAVTGVLPTST